MGAGALGSPAALYLAAAGVGCLGIIDDDVVDVSNLQRQVIHTTPGMGQPKTESARHAVEALNPDVKVITHHTALTSANAMELLAGGTSSLTGPTTSRRATCSTMPASCSVLRLCTEPCSAHTGR